MNPLANNYIEIMDTTLRDGEQTSGVSFSASEKLTISKLLISELSVDRVEISSARVSDGEFNSVKKICNWAKENNISAAIIRPDQHIYGCVDNVDIINNVDKLITKLKGELFKH